MLNRGFDRMPRPSQFVPQTLEYLDLTEPLKSKIQKDSRKSPNMELAPVGLLARPL